MPFLTVVVVVLVAWGAGAAAGSASTYLLGALAGVVIVIFLLGLFGGIADWRAPAPREERLRPY